MVVWEEGGLDMDFMLRNSSVFWVINDKIPSAVQSLTGNKNEISIDRAGKIIMCTMFMSDALDLYFSCVSACQTKSPNTSTLLGSWYNVFTSFHVSIK